MGDAFEQWVEQYRPIANPDGDSGFIVNDQSIFFETHGEDLKTVQAALEKDPAKVWTVLDVDGELYVGEGYQFVNRFGYFLTDFRHSGEPVCIKID
jgi:hypothetical protein